jgi:hypothetical protein
MLLYNVTMSVEPTIEAEWLYWMRTQHVPDVMATGLPVDNKILKLLTEIDNGGITYTFQYFFKSIEDYETYQERYSPTLQNHVYKRYEGKYVSFRTLLEEI